MSIPVITTPFIFAQLSKELTEVQNINATIVNLYKDISGSPYLLSILNFINIFYGNNGNFGFDCAVDPTASWFLLSNWIQSPSAGTSFMDISFNIIGFMKGQWGEDLGIPSNCWTICSNLWITKDLLKANNICSLQCNVCCSLCSYELAETLNSLADTSFNILNQYSPRSAAQPVILDDHLALSILFTNGNLCTRPIDIRLNFRMIIADTWKSENSPSPSSGHWSSLASGVHTIAPVLTTEIIIHKDSLCSGISYREFLTDDYLNGRTLLIAGESDTCPHITSSELVTPLFVNGQYNNGQDDSNGPDSAGEYSLTDGTGFILDCSDPSINSIVFNRTDSSGADQTVAITAITSGTLTIQKQSNGYPNNYCLLEVASSAIVGNTAHIAGTWTEGNGDLSGVVEVYHSESGELTAYYTITNHTFTDPHVKFDVTYISTIPSGANWAVTSRNSLITIQ